MNMNLTLIEALKAFTEMNSIILEFDCENYILILMYVMLDTRLCFFTQSQLLVASTEIFRLDSGLWVFRRLRVLYIYTNMKLYQLYTLTKGIYNLRV